MSGTFYSELERDIDYLYISVDSPAMISGELTAVKGIDSEILFFRKGEARPYKTVNDNKSSLNERFGPYYISEPGVVIALRPVTGINDPELQNLKYEFSYSLKSPPVPVEIESNDTPEAANLIENNIIHGYFNNMITNNEIEKDYYYIELPEKKKYRISARLSSINEIDSILRMYSASGELLQMEDSGITSEPENIYSYGVDGPSRVYFSVNAKDFKVSDSDYYELSVSANEYEDKYELEPNNIITRATSIAVDKIYADFSNNDDVDFYKYFNSSFDTLNFQAEVTADSQFDMVLEIFPLLGSQPIKVNDSGPGGSEGYPDYVLKPLETVYLKVSRINGQGTGSYNLNTMFTPYDSHFEKEPNNTVKNSNSILPLKEIRGFISPKEDHDYYKIKIPGQMKVNIELESQPFCLAVLSVLDAKGIKTDGKTALHTGEKVEINSIVEPNGYIKVSCETIDKPGYTEPYRLLVSEEK